MGQEQDLPFTLSQSIASAMQRPSWVCTCLHLTKDDLVQAIQSGQNSFEKLQRTTGCSTACGNCENLVHQILAEYKKKK